MATKLSYVRDGIEYACEVEALPPASIAYLLQYGFAQSLQDCIAGRAKAVREEGGDETAIAQDLAGTLGKRLDAILQGTVGVRQSAESILPGRSAMFVRVAKEFLTAIAKAQGKKLPKADSDEYRAMLRKVAEAKASEIEAEAARRTQATSGVEIEL